MKIIKLTKGFSTIVDDEDFEYFNQWRWQYKYGYACRTKYTRGQKREHISLHREIMDCPNNMVTDHINRNTLDNRKSNLRICTHSQNVMNSKVRNDSTSGYKGVAIIKSVHNGKTYTYYNGYITKNGTRINLGCHSTPEKAALTYNEKALELFGEFANLNLIP